MSTDNKPFQPFLLFLSVVIFLFGISFFNELFQQFSILKIKKVDLLSDIKLKEQKHGKFPQSYFVISGLKASPVVRESKPNNPPIQRFSEDTANGLNIFLNALAEAKKQPKKVRVAYFGDSMIEGDLITQDLRSLLQGQFGGKGVGFVPVTSITSDFRRTIRHKFSDNWTDLNLLSSSVPELGLSGHVFLPTFDSVEKKPSYQSWVTYKSVPYSNKLNEFNCVKLFYGRGDSTSTVSISSEGKNNSFTLAGNDLINELTLCSAPTKELNASFNFTHPLPVYGFSFESENGVFVDNYSFRGNSGLPLTKIPARVCQNFNKFLDYDLIILHYGLNAISPEMTDYGWYEKGLENVVAYFKRCFPNTSILVVSVSDKSGKVNDSYETEPGVPLMVEAQRRIAKKQKVAFWSLYDAMGGYNSMVKWVNADTALANKDYTHLNFRGSHKVGAMLYSQIMKEYNQHIKTRSN